MLMRYPISSECLWHGSEQLFVVQDKAGVPSWISAVGILSTWLLKLKKDVQALIKLLV